MTRRIKYRDAMQRQAEAFRTAMHRAGARVEDGAT